MSQDTPTPTQPLTLVFFHAHPDDEASSTSGTMARAVEEGHRVITVYGTNGDHGEVPDDLAEGETLVDRRRKEAMNSAATLGVDKVYWLDYADSGMTGWEQNAAEHNFMQAPVDEAARKLADILDAEKADVLVGYDWHGSYGHPDHVKVHVVGQRALELAARRPRELQTTINRTAMQQQMAAARAAGLSIDFDPGSMTGDDGLPIGSTQDEIHWAVDIRPWIAKKRAALACHASQTTDVGMFLSIPEEIFAQGFGVEHYIEPGRPEGMVEGWPF